MKLSQAVDLYIQRKRDAGMRFDSPTNKLRSFLRHCGDIDLHHITVQQVTAFLDGSGVMPSTWSGKRGTLRTFFDYWTARGRLKSSPLPPSAPKTTQSFAPYIYSRSDLRSLLDTVLRCQRKSACVMSEATFRTLLLFLYATGMRLGEALRLRLADVDLTLGIITIRDTKFYKSRLVPLGPDIERLIRQYLHQPGRRNQPYRPLFQTKSGNPIPAQVADAETDLEMKAKALGLCEAKLRQRRKRWRDIPDLLKFRERYLNHILSASGDCGKLGA